MAKVPLENVLEGDVLLKDITVGNVTMFDKGTVLMDKIISIIERLGFKEIEIENREGGMFRNIKELYANIDERFDLCDGNAFMSSLKYIVKDIAAQERGYR